MRRARTQRQTRIEAGFLLSASGGEHAVAPGAPHPDAHQLRWRRQRAQRVGRRHVRLVPGAGRCGCAPSAVAAVRRVPAVGLPPPVVPQVEDVDSAGGQPLPQGIRRLAICESRALSTSTYTHGRAFSYDNTFTAVLISLPERCSACATAILKYHVIEHNLKEKFGTNS